MVERRRWARVAVLAGGIGIGLASASAVAAAGGLTLTPSSGAPGSSYDVTIDCAGSPLLYRGNLQAGPWQGTIGPRYPEDMTSLSASQWKVSDTAGDWDAEYWATCDGTSVGESVFDVENPQLWFGPRSHPDDPRAPVGRTQLDGTDCPAGSTAHGQIRYEDDLVVPFSDVPIDERGDWHVPLPKAVGDAEMEIDAACGSVTYERVTLSTTSTTPTPTTPTSTPTTTPDGGTGNGAATPAAPVAGGADFTG